MATNNGQYAVHVTAADGSAVCVNPGDDFPSGVKVDNPYVTGKKGDEQADHEEDAASDESPRRGRPRKAADPA